jgi:hypothetical protein
MFVVAHYEVQFPSLDLIFPPFFPSDHNLRDSPLQLVTSHFQDIDPSHPTPPQIDLVSLGVAQPIATILTSVQHISQLVPTFDSYPTASTNLVILTRMCTLLSHLLSLPPIRPTSDEDQHSALISESVRFAILLHVFTPWRGLQPDGTLTINHLLHRLIAYIHALHSNSINTNNDLLLWIFAVGGIASANMPERVWFVGHLAEMMREMGIERWEEMKVRVIRGGIWHERLYRRTMKELWDEVVMQGKILDGESGTEGDLVNG